LKFHQVKTCYTEKFLLQKLDYPPRRTGIHNNPIMPEWKLASHPEEYFHSSTCFYILDNQHQFIRVTHWKDVGEHITHCLRQGEAMLDSKLLPATNKDARKWVLIQSEICLRCDVARE